MSEVIEPVSVYMTAKQEQNFWESVDKAGPIMPHMEDECWMWTGAVDKRNGKANNKYGRVSITDAAGQTKTWRVPKLAYLHFVGPIAPGLLTCHHCDNPTCTRPSHLYLDTHAGNMATRNRRGRQARGVTSGMSKLTEEQVRDIYTSKSPAPVLALRYNVKRQTVTAIRLGKTWKHVTNNLSLASVDN